MIDGKRVLAVVPARGGSKGIPGKNLVLLCGKPLLQWTIEAAQNSRYVDRLVLSSDDEAICKVGQQLGCDVPFKRPKILASDDATTVDVIKDIVDRLPGFDLVVVLQPTSPLRITEDIDQCLRMLVERNYSSIASITAVKDHPFLTYKTSEDGLLEPFVESGGGLSLRRQDLPEAYVLNGAMYAVQTNWFISNLALVSDDTGGFVMPLERSVDIDDWADLAVAENLLRND